jgi:hypothetical protein
MIYLALKVKKKKEIYKGYKVTTKNKNHYSFTSWIDAVWNRLVGPLVVLKVAFLFVFQYYHL